MTRGDCKRRRQNPKFPQFKHLLGLRDDPISSSPPHDCKRLKGSTIWIDLWFLGSMTLTTGQPLRSIKDLYVAKGRQDQNTTVFWNHAGFNKLKSKHTVAQHWKATKIHSSIDHVGRNLPYPRSRFHQCPPRCFRHSGIFVKRAVSNDRQRKWCTQVFQNLQLINSNCSTFKRIFQPCLSRNSLVTLTEEMFCDALSQDGIASASSSLTRSEPGFHGQWNSLPGSLLVVRCKKNNLETKLLRELLPAQTAHTNKIQNPLISHHVMTHALKCTDKHALLFVCAMLAFRTPSCTASEVKFSLPRYSFQILQNWNTGHESYKLTPAGSTSHRLKVRQPIWYVPLPWQAMANYWHPTPANLVICKCFVT